MSDARQKNSKLQKRKGIAICILILSLVVSFSQARVGFFYGNKLDESLLLLTSAVGAEWK